MLAWGHSTATDNASLCRATLCAALRVTYHHTTRAEDDGHMMSMAIMANWPEDIWN